MTEEATDELTLFKPIIDAFVKKYPGVEYGPNHIVFGDYNLEFHWLVYAQLETGERNGSEQYDSESGKLLESLITICELLELEL